MFKKISLIGFLSAALLFGGLFNTSAFAAQQDSSNVKTYSKVYYTINSNFGSFNSLNDYINQCFKNWKNQNQNQSEDKVENPNQNQVQKPEQPVQKPEQPEQNQAQKPVQKPVEQPIEQNQGSSYQLNDFEQQVFDLTNNERTKNGLAPLKIDLELSRVAREKSQDMANLNYFDHNSPTYGSPFDMMKAYGITYRSAGENIAKGQRTPAEVVNAWMNSPGHRANILNGNFTHIGIGYVTQGNHWTQQFIGK